MVRRALIVTADDFGLSREVNEAVEIAHRDGILSAASLMVAELWAGDAAERAGRMPGLGIGLHLTLVEGRPMLPSERVPDLVGPNGRLRTDLARYGAEIFFRPGVARQVAAEIRAQFEAFARTGLSLDHVNSHKHFHLHPTIAGLVIGIGREFGMRALRVPVEPSGVLARVEPVRLGLEARLAGPWARRLQAKARRAGLLVPDAVFGLAWSGAMTGERVSGLIRHLPPGLTEIYAHPALAGGFPGAASTYRYADEYAALTSAAVARAVDDSEARHVSFAGFERDSTGSGKDS